jgi:GTP-binding protein
LGTKAIVVINKVDRKDADNDRVLNDTFDLFIELGATEQQADFSVVYTIATAGRAGLSPEVGQDLQPLFETILRHIPKPQVEVNAPLQMLVTTLDYDSYRGLTAIGRIFRGQIQAGQAVARLTRMGDNYPERVRYLYIHEGLKRTEVAEASAGEIVAIAGLEAIAIGETLADPENPDPLPLITVEEPTIRMTFGINTSPFAGKEGRWSTSRKLRERLYEELKHNISLRVEETNSADTFIVSGRGELHLAILIETMRREGYEFHVSPPEVIFRTDENGEMLEPYEELFIETSAETVGAVVEMLGKRRGEMYHTETKPDGSVQMTYIAPTRGLLGFRYHFMTATRGTGIIHSLPKDYGPVAGKIHGRSKGSLVAWETGPTTSFGLENGEERGVLFVAPGVDVYAGQVVGEHQRPGDLDINVCKRKQMTNMRQAFRDVDQRLTPPRLMSLDECIEYLADDELLEVTPQNLRIRKRVLDRSERARETKRTRQALEA